MTNYRGENGFTLIELLVAIALMSVVGALSLTALVNYRQTQGHQQTANGLLSDLRSTGQRAVSEGRTYCLYLDSAQDSWTVYRSACGGSGTVVDPATKAAEDTQVEPLSIATPASAACPTTGACIYFYPRGTATQSSVAVARSDKPSISVTVEGLTGRVDRT